MPRYAQTGFSESSIKQVPNFFNGNFKMPDSMMPRYLLGYLFKPRHLVAERFQSSQFS